MHARCVGNFPDFKFFKEQQLQGLN